ncbi:Protein of unknown function [Lactobacillus delbrueckii subsp. bulgaricus]|nr:Protein of unknown function [Lactobacillus delbrueckii subsp. bulgaricus]
MLGMAANKVR